MGAFGRLRGWSETLHVVYDEAGKPRRSGAKTSRAALIGLMVYSFARVGAAIGMNVEDVYSQNRRLSPRLHEKGRQAARHAAPAPSAARSAPARPTPTFRWRD